MNTENQSVQCLQCERVKSSEGDWYSLEAKKLKEEISHTYCPDCITVLQDRLIAARHFKNWAFEKQIEFLQDDLTRHDKKFDRPSLRNYLEEFFVLESENYNKYYEALEDYLAGAVCTNCHEELESLNEKYVFGPHYLHAKCYNELTNKMKIILDNNWESSDKFSAYLDLLKIEQSVRPALKNMLKKNITDEPLAI